MKTIIINGGHKLNGTIRISGAKNASVALIPASILTSEETTICNVPEITDTDNLIAILKFLNVKVKRASESLLIDASQLTNKKIEKSISSKLRASYYFMGALLGRYHYVEMHFPGGCAIGKRPIDQHIKGFESLGAHVEFKNGDFKIWADELKGADIYLDIPSVGATINILLAAVLAQGKTVITNAAKEPEIVNIATYLNNMGAQIRGAGTSQITIVGVKKLHSAFIEVIPDRIEAGTYLLAGALLGDNLKIDNIIPDHIESITSKLISMKGNLIIKEDNIIINSVSHYKNTNIKTAPYPGFPTDLQQPFSVVLTQAEGDSIINESIYENRFMQVPYLEKMGANIDIEGTKIIIHGPTKLEGSQVIATDLRAGAALILAGLIADKTTIINDAEHILRGYENIVEKLSSVGADIFLKEEE